MGDDASNADGPYSRRRLLGTAAAAGAGAWVTPVALSFNTPASASSSLATVAVGTPEIVPGNSARTIGLPAGTFTRFLVVVAQVSDLASPGLPSWVTSTGWNTTTLVANIAGSPALAVYQSTTGTPAAPRFDGGNESNGRWAAVVIGFTTGTTATASAMSSASNGTLGNGITFNAATAGASSTWVAIGTSTTVGSATNWVNPSGYTQLLDFDAGGSFAIDLFVTRYNILSTSVSEVSGVEYGSSTATAKGVHVGVG